MFPFHTSDMNTIIFSLLPTDWVDVANDLLSKCHINLRLRKLVDCDANVFIALYQNILGEKVPGTDLPVPITISQSIIKLKFSYKTSNSMCLHTK